MAERSRGDKPFHVVSLGDTVVDLVFEIEHLPILPETVQVVHGPTLEPGGAGNFLIAGARLGMVMHCHGVMGDDIYGHAAAEILAQEGVDISGVVHVPGSTSTLVLVLIDQTGQHAFLGRYGGGDKVLFSDLWRKQIQAADAFFLVAYALFETQIWEATPLALQTARGAGVPIFMDLGPDMSPVPMETRRNTCAYCTVVLGTEKEVRVTTGLEEVEAGVNVLFEWGVPVIVVKRGAQGCRVYTRDEMMEIPAFPVTLRDSTAAGDTFDVAFIYGYLHGYSLRDSALFANAVAGAKVQKIGSGRQVPTAQEVMDLLRRYHVNLPFFLKEKRESDVYTL